MKQTESRWMAAFLVAVMILMATPPGAAGDGTSPLSPDRHRAAVAAALASHGLTPEEVNARLDLLTDEDLAFFAAHPDQIRSAGRQIPDYVLWILIGAVGVLVLVAVF